MMDKSKEYVELCDKATKIKEKLIEEIAEEATSIVIKNRDQHILYLESKLTKIKNWDMCQVSQGYCTKRNEHKILDDALLKDIIVALRKELNKMLEE